MMGSILVALFLATPLGGTGYAPGMSMGAMLAVQGLAVVVVAVYSAVVTALIALGVSLFLPMRVSVDEERQGLDIADHGERGWEFD
jgi:Amt family ammonium transporter